MWITNCGNLRMRGFGVISTTIPSLAPNKWKKKKTPTDVRVCEAGMPRPSGQMHPQQVDNPALAHLSVDNNLQLLR